MLEALEYYQSLAQKFQTQLLTAPGVLLVLIGLSVWLAGLRWRWLLGALAGATMAIVGVFALGAEGLFAVTVAVAVGFAAGLLMDKIVLGIFGTIFAAGIVLLFFACDNSPPAAEFYSGSGHDSNTVVAEDFITQYPYPTWPQYHATTETIASPMAVEITIEMARYFVENSKKGLTLCGSGSFACAGFAAIIMTVIAMATARLFISLMSSAIGTTIIFVGMTMLLFYKGSAPITLISQRPTLYSVVFLVMIIFGAVVQLVLSPPSHKTIKTHKKNKDKGKEK
ncbi:MAG: hypothetical protein K8R02_08700 [Anaerohalosphaeraceae bacterium]|nr:hypothetical protein [Anaerohalosphaeraceae bacterium]